MILGDVFERNARCFGSHAALLFEGRTVTHGALFGRVTKLINALASLDWTHPALSTIQGDMT